MMKAALWIVNSFQLAQPCRSLQLKLFVIDIDIDIYYAFIGFIQGQKPIEYRTLLMDSTYKKYLR
jgi:hypothetical protein